MKTTIDLPDSVLHRAKVAAARQRTTLKDLVIKGLELVMQPQVQASHRDAALARLKKGFHLKGKHLTRDELHER